MTDKVLVSNYQSIFADTIEIVYTDSTVNGTRIKAFTASNDTETSHTYKAYIYPPSGSAEPPVIPQTIVVRDRADSAPYIVNQLIPPGGTLRVESSNANSISFYVTGVEQ